MTAKTASSSCRVVLFTEAGEPPGGWSNWPAVVPVFSTHELWPRHGPGLIDVCAVAVRPDLLTLVCGVCVWWRFRATRSRQLAEKYLLRWKQYSLTQRKVRLFVARRHLRTWLRARLRGHFLSWWRAVAGVKCSRFHLRWSKLRKKRTKYLPTVRAAFRHWRAVTVHPGRLRAATFARRNLLRTSFRTWTNVHIVYSFSRNQVRLVKDYIYSLLKLVEITVLIMTQADSLPLLVNTVGSVLRIRALSIAPAREPPFLITRLSSAQKIVCNTVVSCLKNRVLLGCQTSREFVQIATRFLKELSSGRDQTVISSLPLLRSMCGKQEDMADVTRLGFWLITSCLLVENLKTVYRGYLVNHSLMYPGCDHFGAAETSFFVHLRRAAANFDPQSVEEVSAGLLSRGKAKVYLKCLFGECAARPVGDSKTNSPNTEK